METTDGVRDHLLRCMRQRLSVSVRDIAHVHRLVDQLEAVEGIDAIVIQTKEGRELRIAVDVVLSQFDPVGKKA